METQAPPSAERLEEIKQKGIAAFRAKFELWKAEKAAEAQIEREKVQREKEVAQKEAEAQKKTATINKPKMRGPGR
jgi:hypothetical protein